MLCDMMDAQELPKWATRKNGRVKRGRYHTRNCSEYMFLRKVCVLSCVAERISLGGMSVCESHVPGPREKGGRGGIRKLHQLLLRKSGLIFYVFTNASRTRRQARASFLRGYPGGSSPHRVLHFVSSHVRRLLVGQHVVCSVVFYES